MTAHRCLSEHSRQSLSHNCCYWFWRGFIGRSGRRSHSPARHLNSGVSSCSSIRLCIINQTRRICFSIAPIYISTKACQDAASPSKLTSAARDPPQRPVLPCHARRRRSRRPRARHRCSRVQSPPPKLPRHAQILPRVPRNCRRRTPPAPPLRRRVKSISCG